MNLLITGAWLEAKENIIQLEKLGHCVKFMQYEKEEIPCVYEWVEGVICNGLFLYHKIEKFTNLKYIQLTSVGYERVPMEYVKEHNITIYNARGVYSIPMAEFAIAGVLQLYKQSRFFYENQKRHKWEKNRGVIELEGKTVCIVGCGSVGTECAKRFKAFGCQLIGIDLYPKANESYDEMFHLEDFEAVLPKSDIVVLTLPLTNETRYLMNEARLNLLKREAILINIARGGVVDTDALINILPNLGGTVLDVFEEEPLTEDNPLWNMANVIITPHNSFIGEGNDKRLQNLILTNMEKYQNEKDGIY